MQKELLTTLQALKKALELSPEEVLIDLLKMVLATTNANTARLWIEDSENPKNLKCIASVPIDYAKWKKLKQIRVKKSMDIIKKAFKNPGIVQQQTLTKNSKDSYAKVMKQEGLNLICGINLGQKHNKGLISIDFLNKKPIKKEIKLAEKALETSTSIIGLLFSNESWIASLEKLAKMDELTRIYNIREYNAQLAFEVEKRKKRKSTPFLFLAEFDIDDFKKINDKFESHIIGDMVLEEMGNRILQFISKNNLSNNMRAFRRGGDEFAVLVRNKNRTQCRQIIEKLFNNLIKPIKITKDKKTITIPIGVSMGCAMFEERYTYQDFRNTVEARLYYAKKTGKNKIVGKKEHN